MGILQVYVASDFGHYYVSADPIMDNITRLTQAIGMPSFFLSFVIVPLPVNARTAFIVLSKIAEFHNFIFDIFRDLCRGDHEQHYGDINCVNCIIWKGLEMRVFS
ncbi:uncharacterized protein LOC107845221 [Capsicum annuum]|uniref:uncharacterized protein LOC107845221 n=1 Tax=Capsicum annuum TaxID=4072 RepID=UPI0007BEEE99|nr:uncharacterized protein LOC107845221 [Capsicum annuum]